MLFQLNIVNFALIENLSICFEQGLNVFSGETGAGKSILIDAINYVLGGKFSKDLIRTGETKTYVEAVFTVENIRTEELMKEYDIEYEDIIIISRETFASGRSIVKVNGKSIILSSLKPLSATLLDIHGQHENQNLLDPANHMNYLDSFADKELSSYVQEYDKCFKSFNNIKNKILEIQGKDGEREKLITYLQFQLEEINACKFKVGEEEELKEKYDMLMHGEKISNALINGYEILYNGSEVVPSLYDSLGNIIKELRMIENYFQKAKAIADNLQDNYFAMEQSIEELRSIKDDIYFDPEELSFINSRIYEINKIKKKYGAETIEDILKYRDKIQIQYEEMVNSEEIVESLHREQKEAYSKAEALSKKIHGIRVKNAQYLQEKIKEELTYIGLEKSTFVIEVKYEDNLSFNGADKVQFLISTNPGEPVKPLEKVASGGELSRIMLALKTVFVDKDKIPTVIFDEIDTGISGRIAQRVAEKMFVISKTHQVFCVTHLPQIAGMSDFHYLITKNVKDEKTFTKVEKLNESEKELEVARMIGGAQVTDLTIQNAKELISLADCSKKSMAKIF